MGLRDKLREASSYLRKLRRSRGPDSYFQYKRARDYEREQDDDARAYARDSADRDRKKAEREGEHEERYTRERGDDS